MSNEPNPVSPWFSDSSLPVCVYERVWWAFVRHRREEKSESEHKVCFPAFILSIQGLKDERKSYKLRTCCLLSLWRRSILRGLEFRNIKIRFKFRRILMARLCERVWHGQGKLNNYIFQFKAVTVCLLTGNKTLCACKKKA